MEIEYTILSEWKQKSLTMKSEKKDEEQEEVCFRGLKKSECKSQNCMNCIRALMHQPTYP